MPKQNSLGQETRNMGQSSISVPEFRPPKPLPPGNLRIPTILEWTSETQLEGTARSESLRVIDEALRIHDLGSGRYSPHNPFSFYPYFVCLTNVYHAADQWIQNHGDGLSTLLKLRVLNLKNVATMKVGQLLGGTEEQVQRRWLERRLVPLSAHGKSLDYDGSGRRNILVIYLKEAEAMQLRIRFRSPLAYQLPIFDPGAADRLTEQECDTTEWTYHPAHDALDAEGVLDMVGKEGVGGYALDAEGRLYVAKHGLHNTTVCGEANTMQFWHQILGVDPQKAETNPRIFRGQNFYHSAYTSGGAVLAAGNIRIQRGRITYLDNMSGHYQPEPRQLRYVLDALRLNCIPLEPIKVLCVSGPGKPATFQPATEFYNQH